MLSNHISSLGSNFKENNNILCLRYQSQKQLKRIFNLMKFIIVKSHLSSGFLKQLTYLRNDVNIFLWNHIHNLTQELMLTLNTSFSFCP